MISDTKLLVHEVALFEVEMPTLIELELSLESDPPLELIPNLNQIKHKFESESESHLCDVKKCLKTDSGIDSGHES